MAKVFRRQGTASWYMTYWDVILRKWVQKSTRKTKKKDAEKVLADMQAMQFRRARVAGVDPGPNASEKDGRRPLRSGGRNTILLADATESWLVERAEAGRANHANEAAHLRNHLLPELGTMPLVSVRPKHIRNWVRGLEQKRPAVGRGPTAGRVPEDERRLAPRTIRKIYGTVHKMFEDFVADELISASPCRVKREDLPPDIDRDAEWRDGAVFTTKEVEALLSDERVPEQRRMYYGLAFLAGLRHGEIAGLRVRHVVPAEPLQKLLVAFSYGGRTKTLATRKVPIHPVLAAILAEWRLGGFARWTGRPPGPDDYLLPGPVPRSRAPERGDADRILTRHTAYKRFTNVDLPALGFRHRRVHDARRTFVSMARSGGAPRDVLKDITHAPAKTILDMYTSFDWDTKCEAVMCIDVQRRTARVEASGEAR